MGYKTANSVWAAIPGTVNPGDTLFTLTSGHGSRFAFCAGTYNYTFATLLDTSANPPTKEVVKLTYSGSGDLVTVVRAQDGTSALTITTPGAGRLEVRIPAAVLNSLVLHEDLQELVDIKATSVGGAANAITSTHTKPLSDLVGVGNPPSDGMISLFQPTAANTALNPTYSPDGLAARDIRRHNGRGLKPGDLSALSPALVTFRGGSMNAWLLMNPDFDKDFVPNARSSGFTLDRTLYGRTIVCTGTFTINVEPAATLQSDFWCAIVNHGTGVITITANGSEKIHLPGGPNGGLSSMALPWSGTSGPTNVGGIVMASDGSALRVVSSSETHGRLFVTTNQDWVCPLNVTDLYLTMVGGGGGGGASSGLGTAGTASSFGELATVGGGGGGVPNVSGGAGGSGGSGDYVGQAGGARIASGGPSGSGGSGPLGSSGPVVGGTPFGFGAGGTGSGGGGGGGAGGCVFRKRLVVVPGTTYTITLGAAGGGGVLAGAQGAALLEW
jgi:hypothetical protein